MLCNDVDLALICETWLNGTLPDQLLTNCYNFSVFRCDRPLGTGGGVCILSNNATVKAVHVPLPPAYTDIELCVIDILNNMACPVRLFVAYRPPSGNREPNAVQYCANLCNCINDLFPSKGSVVLCGDLNFPEINWNCDNCIHCNDFTCSGLFLSLFYYRGFSQFVLSPTRHNNILDVILSNDCSSILNVCVTEPFSTSDHNTVSFDILYNITPLPSSSQSHVSFYRDFNNVNWNLIRSFLFNVDFDSIFNAQHNVDSVCDYFYSVMYYCIDKFVPVKTSRHFNRAGPRYPYNVRKLFLKKSAAWRVYRSKKTTEARTRYNRIAAESRRAVRSFISESEFRLLSSGNLGQFYRYANKKFCSKSSVGLIRTKSGELSSNPTVIAETFNGTFASYFVHDNSVMPPITKSTTSRLDTVKFTPTAVKKAIQRLKTNSKGGPDGIPPIFYKRLSDTLSFLLCKLYTRCFQDTYLPAVWKQAYISPIFKKGNRNDSNNYRPIALTCTMCKLMESVIKEQLLDYLNTNKLISPHQHAFISNHSTATNLLECIHDWTLSLNSHHSTDVIYIDFSRAFDSLVFSKLLHIIKQYGITGKLIAWIANFITDRSQCVAISNVFSSVCDVVSGVPQGSVLGPILFLLYINDIDSVCTGLSLLKLFADDCKLFSKIILNRPSPDLQDCLNRLCTFAEQRQLSINIPKCYVLSTSRSSSSNNTALYFINNQPIISASSVVDLGVTISYDLSFKTHINNIVATAYQRQSIFFRGFLSRDLKFARKAFITYIRPILEYNSIIWNPTEIYLIDLIENVQRHFTKNIPSIASLPYKERLSRLNLEPLELRRLHFDLINYFKILNNLSPIDPSQYFTIYHSLPSSRSDSTYLHRPVKAAERTLSSFFYRQVAAWNSLPTDVTHLPTVAAFKSAVKSTNLNSHMKGNGLK